MDVQTERVSDFLYELYRQVNGQEKPQVSMHIVGANIGLEKDAATALAEELMISDLVELKTLAGEIGITAAGLDVLQEKGMINGGAGKSYALSGEPVLTDGDQKVIHEILAAVKLALARDASEYEQMEEAVIDIKTLELQLLSPSPKAAIALAVLSSLKKSFQKTHREEVFSEFASVFNGM